MVYDKKYYEDNKERISLYNKIYRAKNSEKIKQRKKNAYMKNAIKETEKVRRYYYANKEEILKKRSLDKTDCQLCGINIRKDSMSRHKRSKRHTLLAKFQN